MTYEGDQQIRWHRVTRWPQLGTIEAKTRERAYRIARETYGGRPVLEEIDEPIHYVG